MALLVGTSADDNGSPVVVNTATGLPVRTWVQYGWKQHVLAYDHATDTVYATRRGTGAIMRKRPDDADYVYDTVGTQDSYEWIVADPYTRRLYALGPEISGTRKLSFVDLDTGLETVLFNVGGFGNPFPSDPCVGMGVAGGFVYVCVSNTQYTHKIDLTDGTVTQSAPSTQTPYGPQAAALDPVTGEFWRSRSKAFPPNLTATFADGDVTATTVKVSNSLVFADGILYGTDAVFNQAGGVAPVYSCDARNRVYSDTPMGFSIGWPCADATAPPAVNPPTIHAPAITAIGPQLVVITAASGVVHYTLDGSVPGAMSPVYTFPIYLSTTTMIRAVAIAGIASAEAQATITIAGAKVAPIPGYQDAVFPLLLEQYKGDNP